MAQSSSSWLKEVSAASESLKKAHAFIVGGPLTETLVAIGDAHTTSAKDHLTQAARSKAARERLLQAAGDLQAAFHLYEQSLQRGIRTLRLMVAANDLWNTRCRAFGCASSIALIQWRLGEAESNVREWLDRARRHLKAYEEDRWARRNYSYFGDSDWHYGDIDNEMDALAMAYFSLERNILPPKLVPPLPLHFRPISDWWKAGYSEAQTRDLEWLTKTGREHRWE